MTAVMHLAKNGNTEEIKKIMIPEFLGNRYIDTDKDGMTAIMHAAREGHLETVKAILEKARKSNFTMKGSLINQILSQKDDNNKTPLMHAIEKGHLKIVKELLKFSPTVNEIQKPLAIITALKIKDPTISEKMMKLIIKNRDEVYDLRQLDIDLFYKADELRNEIRGNPTERERIAKTVNNYKIRKDDKEFLIDEKDLKQLKNLFEEHKKSKQPITEEQVNKILTNDIKYKTSRPLLVNILNKNLQKGKLANFTKAIKEFFVNITILNSSKYTHGLERDILKGLADKKEQRAFNSRNKSSDRSI
jgi:hypothetical protein